MSFHPEITLESVPPVAKDELKIDVLAHSIKMGKVADVFKDMKDTLTPQELFDCFPWLCEINKGIKKKKHRIGLTSFYNDRWLGRYCLINPDLDFHKNEKWDRLSLEERENRKNEIITRLKALQYCLAIFETDSGGLSPIFLIDTESLPEDCPIHPSDFIKYPEWLLRGFEVKPRKSCFEGDTRAQKRFICRCIWTNPDVVPYVYRPLSDGYKALVTGIRREKRAEAEGNTPTYSVKSEECGKNMATINNSVQNFSTFNFFYTRHSPTDLEAWGGGHGTNDLAKEVLLNHCWILYGHPQFYEIRQYHPDLKNEMAGWMPFFDKIDQKALKRIADATHCTVAELETMKDLIAPKTLKNEAKDRDGFRDFMATGLDYTKRNLVIAPMGYGKTYGVLLQTALCLLILVKEVKLKEHIKKQAEKLGRRVCIINIDTKAEDIDPDADVYIMTYDKFALPGWQADKIKRMIEQVDCIVCDECQNITYNHAKTLLYTLKPFTLLSANNVEELLPQDLLNKVENKYCFEKLEKPRLRITCYNPKKVNWDRIPGQFVLGNSVENADVFRSEDVKRTIGGDLAARECFKTNEDVEEDLRDGKQVITTNCMSTGLDINVGRPIHLGVVLTADIYLSNFTLPQFVGRARDGVSELSLTIARYICKYTALELEWAVYFAKMISVKKFNGLTRFHKLAIVLADLARSFDLEFVDGISPYVSTKAPSPRATHEEMVQRVFQRITNKERFEIPENKKGWDIVKDFFAEIKEYEWSEIYEVINTHSNIDVSKCIIRLRDSARSFTVLEALEYLRDADVDIKIKGHIEPNRAEKAPTTNSADITDSSTARVETLLSKCAGSGTKDRYAERYAEKDYNSRAYKTKYMALLRHCETNGIKGDYREAAFRALKANKQLDMNYLKIIVRNLSAKEWKLQSQIECAKAQERDTDVKFITYCREKNIEYHRKQAGLRALENNPTMKLETLKKMTRNLTDKEKQLDLQIFVHKHYTEAIIGNGWFCYEDTEGADLREALEKFNLDETTEIGGATTNAITPWKNRPLSIPNNNFDFYNFSPVAVEA